MSKASPRQPIIIPIPMSHLNVTSDNVDTIAVGPPTGLRISFSGDGWSFYRKTILPYIWQGYQVKIRGQNTRQFPTTAEDSFKIFQADFVVKGKNASGLDGAFGMYIALGSNNTAANNLYKFTQTFYTENGIDYSHYSYVIYP